MRHIACASTRTAASYGRSACAQTATGTSKATACTGTSTSCWLLSQVRGRDIQFEVHPKRMVVSLRGTPLLEGSLADCGEVNVDGECL